MHLESLEGNGPRRYRGTLMLRAKIPKQTYFLWIVLYDCFPLDHHG